MSLARLIRVGWPALVVVACVGFALAAFDWSAIWRGLARMDLPALLLPATALVLVAMAARALRWVAVTGLPFRPRILWDAHCYIAVAIAAASATPMQIGEMLKLRFAQRASGLLIARSGLAFAMERVADLVAILCLLAIGLAGRGGGEEAAVAAALAGLGLLYAMPGIARRLVRIGSLPAPVAGFLAPLLEARLSQRRFAVLITCTAVKWASVVALWQVPLDAAGAAITVTDTALLVAGVTLAGVVSLVPGSIGVAEVSTRAMLVWFGVDVATAETAAIALRLLTLIVIAAGLAHTAPMILASRTRRAAEPR